MKKIKYLLLIIAIVLISIVNVSAKEPETKDRKTLDNYGVNKKWKITDKNKNNVLSTKYVNAEEKIYDFSGVLTDEEYENLKKQALAFKEKTNMDLVILIDNFSYISDSENEDRAADFYDYNDFGLNNDEYYSGVLLLRNTYEQDPYYNIYTFGNAQLYFHYDRLESTLDHIYNDIHEGRYESGLGLFITEMSSYYDQGIPSAMKNYYLDEDGYLHQHFSPPYAIAFLIALLVSGVTIAILIGKNKMVRKATTAKEYLDENSVNITNSQDIFISTHTTQYTESDSSSSSGGFSSHSGSSGGGHSSGGGRHG